MLDRTVPDQFRQNSFRDAHRDGEAYARGCAGRRFNLRVDTDHAAVRIEQRATGISRVNRRVGLNRAFNLSAVLSMNRPLEAADDASRQSSIKSEGVTDGQDL